MFASTKKKKKTFMDKVADAHRRNMEELIETLVLHINIQNPRLKSEAL